MTAPLVYVNYGRPEDYEQLDRLGISVRGAIVIARYGQSWRGIKPKVAAEHGAIGCLIYSDPRDDGYGVGRCVPARSDAPGRRRAARQRHGHAGGAGRPVDARGGRHAGRPAPRAQRGHHADEDSGAADLARRCAAAALGDSRRHRARNPGAARCRSPTTSVPVRRRCISRWRSTGTRSRSTTSSPGFRDPPFPTNGSCAGNHHDAWVNGAADPGQRHGADARRSAGARRAAEAGLDAEAHHRLHRVGRRGAGAARIDRVGRNPRRRPEGARRGLHQQRRQRPRLPRT